MALSVRLAVRTLFRNPRRTGITIISIAVSLSVIFWLQSIMKARSGYIIDKVLSLSGGDVQIYKKAYYEDKRLADFMREPLPDFRDLLGKDFAKAERIRVPGLVAAAEESFPIYLNGIDPNEEPKISRVKSFLSKGEFLAPDREGTCVDRPIYIGEKLASLLRVNVGDKIVFLGQAADGTLGNELFRIKGLYNSRSGDYDKVFAFTTLECAKKVGVLGGVHEVAFKLGPESKISVNDIEEVETQLNARISPDLKAVGWRQANPMVAQVLQFNDAFISLLTLILVSIVIFGTVNTLLMSVQERSKEFGVMLALGMQPRQLMNIIVIEAFLMAMSGFLLSLVIGGVAIIYHQWAGFDLAIFVGRTMQFQGLLLDSTIVHPSFALIPFIKASSFMVISVTLAGIYPAYRAGRLTPVDTIRG